MNFPEIDVPNRLAFPQAGEFDLGLRATVTGESLEEAIINGMRFAGLWGELIRSNHPEIVTFSIYIGASGKYIGVNPRSLIEDMTPEEVDCPEDELCIYEVPHDAIEGIRVASGIYEQDPTLIMVAGIAVRRSMRDLSHKKPQFCFAANGGEWHGTEIP